MLPLHQTRAVQLTVTIIAERLRKVKVLADFKMENFLALYSYYSYMI